VPDGGVTYLAAGDRGMPCGVAYSALTCTGSCPASLPCCLPAGWRGLPTSSTAYSCPTLELTLWIPLPPVTAAAARLGHDVAAGWQTAAQLQACELSVYTAVFLIYCCMHVRMQLILQNCESTRAQSSN
jgi:hypothetical protein